MTKRNASKKTYRDCAPEQCFWVHDGQILKNVAELSAALKTMSEETFQYHVNAEKNDFANWIGDVFADNDLAGKVRQASSKEVIIRTLRK